MNTEHLHVPGEPETGVRGVALHQPPLLLRHLGPLVPRLGTHYRYYSNSLKIKDQGSLLTRSSARAFNAPTPCRTVTVIV